MDLALGAWRGLVCGPGEGLGCGGVGGGVGVVADAIKGEGRRWSCRVVVWADVDQWRSVFQLC